MTYDAAKITAQSAAVEILREVGFDVRFEHDRSGIGIVIDRGDGHTFYFMDGFWDPTGEAEAGTLLGLDTAFEAGPYEDADAREIPPANGDEIDWTDARNIAGSIIEAIYLYEQEAAANSTWE